MLKLNPGGFLYWLAILIATNVSTAFAQHNTNQNKIWIFGRGAGVDFTTGVPVPMSTAIYTDEGSASVSSASGNLLFFSDGSKVWNNAGLVMPSGAALVPYSTNSTTQSSLIIPVIGSATQYYLFSLEEQASSARYSHLTYCIVDMSLAGGSGDVVASTLATPVADSLTEKMTVVPGDNCSVWLVVHKRNEAVFLAYEISATGISAPVASSIGTFPSSGFNSYGIGELKASPNGQKLALAVQEAGGTSGAELYDFAPSTGVVSNCVVLDNTTTLYGVEFSPDNSKLYLQGNGSIVQYNITAGSAAAIVASAYTVGVSLNNTGLKLGPDGKIYFCEASYVSLGAITAPNAAGAACGYAPGAVALASGSSTGLGLHNIFFPS